MAPRVKQGGRRSDTATRRSELGGDQVEGRRAVRELLAAGTRAVRTVTIADSMERSDLLDEIIELAGARLRHAPAAKVAALARTEAHQGVVATADALVPADLADLARHPRPFLLALDGVTDPGNLGAVLRTADTAGVTGVIVTRHRSAHVTPTVAKAAAGAIEYVPIALVAGIPNALERLKRERIWSVALDGDGDTALDDLALATEPLVLVLGAEGRGVSRLARERCDVHVRIPMHGHIDSLNVAAAAAIAMHSIATRRTALP
ncbi:MAG TPA: 23S rRNA (guanosine(2251)-2'-O)-methyltransferase RlmB [Acidimicrobiia bacterium]